ncbi:MAG: hypothetical protein AABW48_06015 [Nanoarchaeota archaeon]
MGLFNWLASKLGVQTEQDKKGLEGSKRLIFILKQIIRHLKFADVLTETDGYGAVYTVNFSRFILNLEDALAGLKEAKNTVLNLLNQLDKKRIPLNYRDYRRLSAQDRVLFDFLSRLLKQLQHNSEILMRLVKDVKSGSKSHLDDELDRQNNLEQEKIKVIKNIQRVLLHIKALQQKIGEF